MPMNEDIYRIKAVQYKGKNLPILMQNLNGPCPLLAIANVLLLQQKIHIHSDLAFIDFGQVIQLVGDYLVESNPPHHNPEMQANQQQQIADALAVLPKLGRGLDVNVRFQKVTDFEFTDELSVFDMLGINLLHGWLYDPQDEQTKEAVRDMSYNQLITLLVEADAASHPPPTQKPDPPAEWTKLPSVVAWYTPKRTAEPADVVDGSKEEELNSKLLEKLKSAQAAEEWMQESASQLTYYGLAQLHAGVREGELCVFFRNNHFCTMCKESRQLFLLCTDVGYFDKQELVWEKLADVTGDNMFCDGNFMAYNHAAEQRRHQQAIDQAAQAAQAAQPKPAAPIVTVDAVSQALAQIKSSPKKNQPGEEQIAVGLPVMTEEGEPVHNIAVPEQGLNVQGDDDLALAMQQNIAVQEDADMALAMQLQAQFEEEERAMQEQQQAAPQAAPAGRPGTGGAGRQGAPTGGSTGATGRRVAAAGGSAAGRQRAGDAGLQEYQQAQRERHQQHVQQMSQTEILAQQQALAAAAQGRVGGAQRPAAPPVQAAAAPGAGRGGIPDGMSEAEYRRRVKTPQKNPGGSGDQYKKCVVM